MDDDAVADTLIRDGRVAQVGEDLARPGRRGDKYVGTFATALVALDSGMTTIVDNSHNSWTPEHSSAAVEALSEDPDGLPRRCHQHA